MNEKTRWVNLSSKRLENRKYENPKGRNTGIYLKPATGLWFSLETDDEYRSEWGEYLEYNRSLQSSVMDQNGETNIITAELKDSCYMIDMSQWFDEIAHTMQEMPATSSCEEKRKALLERVKERTGNGEIQYLVYSLKEEDFPQIIDMYVNNILSKEEQEQYRIEKEKQGFHKIDESIAASWLTDYFSASMNLESIDGYDMPSLVLFDTDCVDVLKEEKRTIFEREERHSAKEISEDLIQVGRISIQRDVYEKLIASRESLEREIFGEEK